MCDGDHEQVARITLIDDAEREAAQDHSAHASQVGATMLREGRNALAGPLDVSEKVCSECRVLGTIVVECL
jgi:hypothetical protein